MQNLKNNDTTELDLEVPAQERGGCWTRTTWPRVLRQKRGRAHHDV